MNNLLIYRLKNRMQKKIKNNQANLLYLKVGLIVLGLKFCKGETKGCPIFCVAFNKNFFFMVN